MWHRITSTIHISTYGAASDGSDWFWVGNHAIMFLLHHRGPALLFCSELGLNLVCLSSKIATKQFPWYRASAVWQGPLGSLGATYLPHFPVHARNETPTPSSIFLWAGQQNYRALNAGATHREEMTAPVPQCHSSWIHYQFISSWCVYPIQMKANSGFFSCLFVFNAKVQMGPFQ